MLTVSSVRQAPQADFSHPGHIYTNTRLNCISLQKGTPNFQASPGPKDFSQLLFVSLRQGEKYNLEIKLQTEYAEK